MVSFNNVEDNDPNCYKTAPSGKYPSLFLGKARDFKSSKFPLFETFKKQNVELEKVRTCENSDVMLAEDRSSKMFHDATMEMIQQDKTPTMDVPEYEQLLSRQQLGAALTQYYKSLKYAFEGGALQKKSKRGKRRQRQTKRR